MEFPSFDLPEAPLTRFKRWAAKRRIRRSVRALTQGFRLDAALGELIRELGRQTVAPRLHAEVDEVPLPAPIGLLAYHVAHEAVMNAFSHGEPRDVWISLAQAGGDAVVTLRDNGIGFDPSTIPSIPNGGLALMGERVRIARGALNIRSSPDAGTTVTAIFPVGTDT